MPGAVRTTCDVHYEECPDCHQPMCSACRLDGSADHLNGRCYTCADPSLADLTLKRGFERFSDKNRFKEFDIRQQYKPRKGPLRE